MTVLIALCIDRVVSIPDDATGRLLNQPYVAFIGRLSYSLYMWQQLFLARGTVTVWTSWPVNLIAVFVCALASFYLVEEPISRFRAKLQRNAPPRTIAVAARSI
jgi:peptidoglycan/LPS O-acetylase OafA/YrhL